MLFISKETPDSNLCEPCDGVFLQAFSKLVASWSL